jgi:hypothetical protein
MNNNKLIAEFMGGGDFRTDAQGIEYIEFIPLGRWKVEDVPYRTQWSWIIPVIQQIERRCQGVPEQLLHINLYSTIEEMYEAVVEFIREYNLTPKEVV